MLNIPANITHVILDADGVLIHPWAFASYIKKKYGFSMNVTAGFFKGPFQDCLAGKKDVDQVLPPFLDEWGWKGSVRDFMDLWLEKDDRPDTALIDWIKRFRSADKNKLMFCLASNQEKNRAEYITHQMKFKEFLDKLFFSCHLGCIKPELDFYNEIVRHLGVDPAKTILFDDSSVHVEGARKAGWNAELYGSAGVSAY